MMLDEGPGSDVGASDDDEIYEAFATMDKMRRGYKEQRKKLKDLQGILHDECTDKRRKKRPPRGTCPDLDTMEREELKRYCRICGFSDRGVDPEKIRKRISMFHHGVGVQRIGFDHRYVRLAERGKDSKRQSVKAERGAGHGREEVSGRALRRKGVMR